jgi:hypothetical protein
VLFLRHEFKCSCTYCTICTMFLSTLHITQNRWLSEQIPWHGVINNLNNLCPCGLAWQFRPKITGIFTLKKMKILYKLYKIVLQKWVAVVCFFPGTKSILIKLQSNAQMVLLIICSLEMTKFLELITRELPTSMPYKSHMLCYYILLEKLTINKATLCLTLWPSWYFIVNLEALDFGHPVILMFNSMC